MNAIRSAGRLKANYLYDQVLDLKQCFQSAGLEVGITLSTLSAVLFEGWDRRRIAWRGKVRSLAKHVLISPFNEPRAGTAHRLLQSPDTLGQEEGDKLNSTKLLTPPHVEVSLSPFDIICTTLGLTSCAKMIGPHAAPPAKTSLPGVPTNTEQRLSS